MIAKTQPCRERFNELVESRIAELTANKPRSRAVRAQALADVVKTNGELYKKMLCEANPSHSVSRFAGYGA